MKFIPATSADVETLARLNKDLIEHEQHLNPMTVAQLKARTTSWLQSEYIGYLRWIGDRIVAYRLYRDDGQHYYLRHIFVDRDYRRQGIATALLNWM